MSSPDLTETTTTLSRRNALCGVVAAFAIPTALAACSTTTTPAATTTTTAGTGGTTGGTATGKVLGAVADIPVGGGKIVTGVDGKPWVVVQPTSGTVRAFTAICTHQGTPLPEPVNGVITCPRHMSQFDAATGAVKKDPAQSPLPEHKVAVKDGNVVTT